MENFKVLITAHSFGSCGEEAFNILEREYIEYKILHRKEIFREEDLINEVKEFDGLIVGADIISREVIMNAPKLKIISKHGVGLDNIDLTAAKKKGITVASAAGSNNIAVAELTICMMLALARKTIVYDREVKTGQWNRYKGTELFGATLGVIGTGRIGKEVIQRMSAFGMNILACDKYEDQELVNQYSVKYVSLDELLKESDIICVHVPLNEDTMHLIGKESFKKMKRSAFLINTARGGIIDEEELYHALVNGEIAGAAIDTFQKEPPGACRLLELDNVVATPHIGAYTTSAIDKMSRYSAQAIADYVKMHK